MSIDEYDHARHITAGEMRAMGATLEPHIPDCAFVRRADITMGKITVSNENRIDRTIDMSIEVDVRGPFQWLEINATITVQGKDE